MNIETIVTAIVAVCASGGFWSFLQYKAQQKDKEREVITKEMVDNLVKASLSTLHTNLYRLAKTALRRRYVTHDDLDELEHIFGAYRALGGNGTGALYYERVKALPIKDDYDVYTEEE